MTLLLSQRWCIATTAILTRINGAPFHVLGEGRSAEGNRKALADWWGITDRESFYSTYDWLLNAGHSEEYRAALGLLQGGAPVPSDPEAAAKVEFVRQHGAEIGPRELLAWDYGRAAGIAGWAALAGYIDDKEVWASLLAPGLILQRMYSSWEEYGLHYALGRTFWGGPDPKTFHALEYLRQDHESPWRSIPWLTPLAVPGVEPRWAKGPAAFAQRVPPRQPAAPQPPRIEVRPGAQVIREADGAFLVQGENGPEWLDGHDTHVPREQWQDDWGPWGNIVWGYKTPQQVSQEFMAAELEFRQNRQADPLAAEQKLLARGFRSVGQFYRVSATIWKYLATPTGPTLNFSVLDGDLQQSMLEASVANERAAAQQELAGNPELTAPVNGLDFDTLVLISAHQTLGLSEQEYSQVLAQHGFDIASYNAASAVWMQRMQTDSTAKLGQRYGELFMQKQAEVKAQRAAATGAPAPQALTFEKYCEINGAMAAWGAQGRDSNSEIEKVFGMSMMDYATQSGEVMVKMSTDAEAQRRYMKLVAHFTEQYGGAAPGAPSQDSDLDL